MPNRFILRNCDALVGEHFEHHSGVDIVIEDGLIEGIGQRIAGTDGVDAAGFIAVPGLINCHTHIGDAAFYGRAFGIDPSRLLWPPDGYRHRWMRDAGPRMVERGIASALGIMAQSGTVMFADFREQGIAGARLLREIVATLPLNVLIYGRHERFPLHTEDELRANTGGLDASQRDDIEAMLEVADGFSPLWANDTTDAGLADTARIVRAHGGRLATHSAETPSYRAISRERTGAGDIERIINHLMPDFVVHLTSATHEEMDLLVAAGIPGVMCPRTQAALGIGIPPLTAALHRGLMVGLGTDNAMLTMPDLLEEMAFYFRALRGVTRQATAPLATQILRAATVDAARILDISATHGQLETGRPAHLFLVDASSPVVRYADDPVAGIVCGASRADVGLTLAHGQIAYAQGKFEPTNR